MVMFFRLLRWLNGSGLDMRDASAHLPEIEREADILAHCSKCGTRMFKTAEGQWKAVSIYADTCENHFD